MRMAMNFRLRILVFLRTWLDVSLVKLEAKSARSAKPLVPESPSQKRKLINASHIENSTSALESTAVRVNPKTLCANADFRPHDDTGERMFTIMGSAKANETALYLLYENLEAEKGRRQVHAEQD